MPDVKSRPIGATATLGKAGYPKLRSATGGELSIVTGPSQPGFNPIDLLMASLAACMSMSARIAARDLGHGEDFTSVAVAVTGEKSPDDASELGRLTVTLWFEGNLDGSQQRAIAHRAEDICTVSKSLAARPDLRIGVT